MKAVLLVLATLLSAGVVVGPHTRAATKKRQRSTTTKETIMAPNKKAKHEWTIQRIYENDHFRYYVQYSLTGQAAFSPTRRTGSVIFANKLVCFIGINPPHTGVTGQEKTTMSWKAYVEHHGGSSFRVTNLFAHRATKPGALLIDETEEVHNEKQILDKNCKIYVPCWGRYNKVKPELVPMLKEKALATLKLLKDQSAPVYIFGTNGDNSPKHAMLLKKPNTPKGRLQKVTLPIWKKLGLFAQHCSNKLI